jgi:type II secretory pathway pseudopilin PulG
MGCLIMTGKAAAGFTYIGLLVAIVIIGSALAAVGQVWSTESRREREAELLYRGDTIRAAIAAYMYGGTGQYPMQLQDLVHDQRAPEVKRYLRRIYEDPMTGAADWTLIRGPDGGIMGVASSSNSTPLKVQGFGDLDQSFKDATCYCDWQFVYVPRVRNGPRPPTAAPGTPSTPPRTLPPTTNPILTPSPLHRPH